MGMTKLVETDNFGGDYPDEKFLNLPYMTQDAANRIAAEINRQLSGPNSRRYWRAVADDYELQPGFEP
jgi:hypothetical protein